MLVSQPLFYQQKPLLVWFLANNIKILQHENYILFGCSMLDSFRGNFHHDNNFVYQVLVI
jgi:hypothetical protein